MARNFLTISQADTDKAIAQGIKNREQELMVYDAELDMHTKSAEALSHLSWTPELLKYRGIGRDQMIAMALQDGLSSEQIQAISELNTLDSHLHAIQAVKTELAKVERAYSDLLERLPEERRAAAFAAIAE